MTDTLLAKLKSDIEGFGKKHRVELNHVQSNSTKLLRACAAMAQSWSGSFAGWHGRMYFRNFQKPSLAEQFNGEWGALRGMPEGWEEKDEEAITRRVNDLVGNQFSVKRFENQVEQLRDHLHKLKSEIDTSLAVIDLSDMPKEQQLAEQIEKLAFGDPKVDHLNRNLPKGMMSRDSEALRQGITLPGHLYYEAVAMEGRRAAELFGEYQNLITRLLRQVEIRATRAPARETPSETLYGIHPQIKEKCRSLYESGAYAEAVEKSFKIVRDRLRRLTGHETGSEAFGKGKLHIKGAAAENVDADFNQAAKFLMMAIDMFRNEKSHTSDAKIDDPVRAYQYLVMSSLALALLDNAEIRP